MALTFPFEVTRIKGPPLAWLLDVSDRAVLFCGSSVVVRNDGFLEGVWAGTFTDWDFDSCPDVFGSGGRLTERGWLIVTPSHTLEAVYVLRTHNRGWLASNSLVFLLSKANARFSTPSYRLARFFIRIVRGIHESPLCLQTTGGKLYIFYHHNVLLRSREFELCPKPIPAPFANYGSYVGHLKVVLQSVAANAIAEGRSRRYTLLTTVSSGYDSPACAAITRYAGCTEAITFRTARGGLPDDGAEIARHLSLRILHAKRLESSNGIAEPEFLATGMQGEDIVYSTFEEHITNRVLVTGFHGGRIWSLDTKPNHVIKRGDVSGSSIGEFRLSRDFVHLPLPFVGAQQHPSIARISCGEEMRPYALGGDYDRPIPRRIVEEAGVPRSSFGQRKKAVGLLVFRDIRELSPETVCAVRQIADSLTAFDRISYTLHLRWYQIGMNLRGSIFRSARPLPRRVGDVYLRATDRGFRVIFGAPEIFEHTNPSMGLAFEYALSVMSGRYRAT